MYRWKDDYSFKKLDYALNHMKDIKYVRKNGDKISARLKIKKSYSMSIIISDNVIESCECSCQKGRYCEHIATLLYYIERLNDKFDNVTFYDNDVKVIVDNIRPVCLRDFIYNEMMIDDNLKNKFKKLYDSGAFLNKEYYIKKLNNILKRGESSNYFEIYDLDIIGDSLYNFIARDIESLYRLEEDEFAAQLLNECAFVLDVTDSNDDEWYYCAFVYSNCANKILMRNEEVISKVFEELEENDDNIRRRGL